jgi:hypothetical protein
VLDIGPLLLIPPPPAIIRPAPAALLRYDNNPVKALLPGLTPVVASRPLQLTYVTNVTSTSTSATLDFGNVNFPRAGLAIVAYTHRSGTARTLNSLSIGGTNGSIQLNHSVTSGTTVVAFVTRQVSSGNNNITAVRASTLGTSPQTTVGVWVLTGNNSDTVTDTDTGNSSGATSLALSALTINAGGVAVMAVVHATGSSNTTWTNATERYDVGTGNTHSGADASAAATFTASWSGSQACAAAGVAFR